MLATPVLLIRTSYYGTILAARLMLSQQSLNAAHADVELAGKLTQERSIALAEDEELYVRLAQSVADLPHPGSLPGTHATRPIRLTGITTP